MHNTLKSNMTYEEANARYRYEAASGRIFLRKHKRCPTLDGREICGLDVHGYVQVNAKPYLRGKRLLHEGCTL